MGLVFSGVMGADTPGIEFGALAQSPLDPALEAPRIAATNRAFQAIAGICCGACLLASMLAWFPQPSWNRKSEGVSR